MARKDIISLTDDDYKGKTLKTAPAGEYAIKISPKTAIAKGKQGNIAKVQIVITSGKHKGTIVFDNIAPHVGWKIAQLLKALGIKKTKLTLEEFVKLIKNKELRAILGEEVYNKKKQNKVVQYLPLGADADDEDEEDLDEEDEDLDEDDIDEDDDEDEDEDEDSDDDEDDEDSDDEDEDEDEDEEDLDDEDDDDDDLDDDEDEEDEDDEEEEEEEEAPAPKRRAPVAKKKTVAKKAPAKKVAKKTTRKK